MEEGELYYDEDGDAGGFAQVRIAKLDPGQKLDAGDFTVELFQRALTCDLAVLIHAGCRFC